MHYLILLFSLVVTLMLPTYVFSQDPVRPLPKGRWFNERVTGGPYLAADDYELGRKEVRWQCINVNGSHKVDLVESVIVVIAHQPDLPHRPVFFSTLNNKYKSASDKGKSASDEILITREVASEELQYSYVNYFHKLEGRSIYASLLVYVNIKLGGARDQNSLAPLVAYHDSSDADDKQLSNLLYYAPDCEAANLNGISSRLNAGIVVPPLGRSDDYPAFRITVLGGNNNYLTAWETVDNSLFPWRKASHGSSLEASQKIKNLLLHSPRKHSNGLDELLPKVPLQVSITDTNWTYGDLLRHYFEYHDANENPVNPVVLSGLDFSVEINAIQGVGSAKPWFAPNIIEPTEPGSVPTIGIAGGGGGEETVKNKLEPVDLTDQVGQENKEEKPEPTMLTLTVEFTGDAFSELANENWSTKIKTNRGCEVEKFSETSKALYHLICEDNSELTNLQLFLGDADSSQEVKWLPVKDVIGLHTATTGKLSTIADSEVKVDGEKLRSLDITIIPSTSNELYSNDDIFSNDVYSLSELADGSFSKNNCTVAYKVMPSNIIEKSLTIDTSHCQAQRAIIIAYPEQYQPTNLEKMKITTTFSGCNDGIFKHLDRLTRDAHSWQTSSCVLDANNDNKLPIEIEIDDFEVVKHEFTIKPSDIKDQASEIILRLTGRQVTKMLRPRLVFSATQPFGSENTNPIPNYRLSIVKYVRSTSENNETCEPQTVSWSAKSATLPNLSQARCKSLPTHIRYHYERLDRDGDLILPPNEAYRAEWLTKYHPLRRDNFVYSHDQFKRKLQFKLDRDYRGRIDEWQDGYLGVQYNEENNLDGKWDHYVYTDSNCSEFIGLIHADADFTSIKGNDYNMTWPLYAQIENMDAADEPFSNCAPAFLKENSNDNRQAQVVGFNIQPRFPAGPKVAIVIAISDKLDGYVNSNVIRSTRNSLRDLLGEIIAESKRGIAARVNVIEVTPQDKLKLLFDGTVSEENGADFNSSLGQISTEAPASPRIAAIRNNSLVKEADGGWLLLFAGGNFDREINNIYIDMASSFENSAADAPANTPSRIELFTLDYCQDWTKAIDFMSGLKDRQLVNCQNITDLGDSFGETFASTIDELVWGNN